MTPTDRLALAVAMDEVVAAGGSDVLAMCLERNARDAEWTNEQIAAGYRRQIEELTEELEQMHRWKLMVERRAGWLLGECSLLPCDLPYFERRGE